MNLKPYARDNWHAYEDYLDRPFSIFRNWNATTFSEELSACIHKAAGKRPLTELEVARLAWYPDVAAVHLVNGTLSVTDADRALATPSSRFAALLEFYDELAPILEPKLIEDPESAERIHRWLNARHRPGFHSKTEYLEKLGEDPMRHFRSTPVGVRPERAKLAVESEKHRDLNAAWMFCYVTTHDNIVPEPDMLARLAESEEYSILAALIFRKRGLPFEAWAPLLAAIKSPRWAYYALRSMSPKRGIPASALDPLTRVIMASPPWAVQLWDPYIWPIEQLEAAFGNCVASSLGHPCLPELRSWMRMKFSHAGRPMELEEVAK